MTKKTKNRYTNDELTAAVKAPASAALEPFPSNDDLSAPVYLPVLRRMSYAMSADILRYALFGIAFFTLGLACVDIGIVVASLRSWAVQVAPAAALAAVWRDHPGS